MQQGKQLFWARLQFLAWLTLNAGNDTANQPARLAQLDDGNDRPILVQGHEGPAQIVRLGHRGTPSIDVSDEIAILAARPIASHRWREVDSNLQSPSAGEPVFSRPHPPRNSEGFLFTIPAWIDLNVRTDLAAPAYAEDIAYIIEQVGLGKVVAVGRSMDGVIVLQLAAAHPGFVAAIVMVDPPLVFFARAAR